jgi:aerobic C4-dicarboxylate transport protein
MTPPARTPLYISLYVQVLTAIALGVLFGWLAPHQADAEWVSALGEGFVKLIKMTIPALIFCTVSLGIAHVQDTSKVGRVGVKALIYFETVSTLALALGLLVGNLVRPGDGFPGKVDAAAIAQYAEPTAQQGVVSHILHLIPKTLFSAFVDGDILQVLVVSILFGFALLSLGERGAWLRKVIEEMGQAIAGVIGIIMRGAPLGAFGAMAYAVGHYGVLSLVSLAWLVGSFYLTAALFVVVGLGLIARLVGFNIFRFLVYIKDELLIVLGTSSSESVLARLMEKMERLGCSKAVVRLVVPTGYSFNLDGTNIYMTLATTFIAQALGAHLSFAQQATILGVAMLTSKGASGVTGAGFVTLAATLSAVDPSLTPGMAMLLGVDKFMSECRALTNLCGNAVATVVVAAWEGELDRERLAAELSGAAQKEPAPAAKQSGD